MQAIILAAGMGKRLGELTRHNTKCMVEINGVKLIDRLLRQLSEVELQRIIIVTGYYGERLQQHVGAIYNNIPVKYVHNVVYDKTNNIYSLALAINYLQEDDTLLVESDLIFEDGLFKLVVDDPFPNLAIVAKYEPWMDGTMVKLNEERDIINFVLKKNFEYAEIESYYKTVNIYKFSKEFSVSTYIPFLEAYTKARGNNEYYEQVLRVITLLEYCDLKALPLDNQRWYEIDDVQDLNIAETIFANSNDRLALYQKRYGGYWRFPGLLDFCYLVNPYFPPVLLKEEMKASFDVLLSEYPSGLEVNNLLMAKYFGIKKEYVCVGNGAAELIKSLMENLDGKIGVVYPTFEEYPNRLDKKRLVVYEPNNIDFAYSVDDLLNFFDNKDIKILLVINPDNPSGNFIPRVELLRLLDKMWHKRICLIVDESFVDFSVDYETATLFDNDLLEKYTNLVVVKSISKSYGVPGIRLGGIATSDVNLLQKIRRSVAIWNINSYAEFYMQIFGKYEKDYKEACKKFLEERVRFRKQLSAISFLRVLPSQANYFLCEVVAKYSSLELTSILLEKYNILIKDCSNKKGFDKQNYVRIAIRDTRDNDCLCQKLKFLDSDNY